MFDFKCPPCSLDYLRCHLSIYVVAWNMREAIDVMSGTSNDAFFPCSYFEGEFESRIVSGGQWDMPFWIIRKRYTRDTVWHCTFTGEAEAESFAVGEDDMHLVPFGPHSFPCCCYCYCYCPPSSSPRLILASLLPPLLMETEQRMMGNLRIPTVV